MQVNGRVVEVYLDNVGSVLAADALAGATQVSIITSADFDEAGGSLVLDGAPEVYAYTIAEEHEEYDVLTLVPGLAADREEGTPISLHPYVEQKVASVRVEDDEPESDSEMDSDNYDGVAISPLVADTFALGSREADTGEYVLLDNESGDWEIVQVYGQSGEVVGESVSGPLPNATATDGLPPAETPAPRCKGIQRAILIQWDPVVNRDLAEVEIHMMPDTVALPVFGDPATRVGVSAGNMVAVHTLPDGITSLDYGTIDPETGVLVPKPYYFRLIAFDADGPAAPSAVAVGSMNQAASGDIAVGSVTAEKLEAVMALLTTLKIGTLIDISPPTFSGGVIGGGITVADPAHPDGEPLVRLHPHGCTFKGKVVTDILTVMKDLIINGHASLSSEADLFLENGVTDPPEGPALTVGPETTAWPTVASGYASRGIAWDEVANCWIRLIIPTSGDVAGRARVQRISAAGVLQSSITLNNGTEQTHYGIVRMGSFYYTGYLSSFEGTWGLARWNATSGDLSGNVLPPNIFPQVSGRYPMVVKAGASEVMLAYFTTSTNVKFRIYNSSLDLTQSGDFTISGAPSQALHGLYGAFDFGANRLVIAMGSEVRVYTVGASWAGFTEDPAARFTLVGSPFNGAFSWDGTRFVSASSGDNVLNKYSNDFPILGEKRWAIYADTNATGTTKPSPARDVVPLARRYVTVNLRATPPGVTGADVWMGYGETLPTTFYKRSEPLSGRTMRLTGGKQTTGATTLPGTNTLGGSPGKIKDGFGGSWGGDGTFKMRRALQGGLAVGPSLAADTNGFVDVVFKDADGNPMAMQSIPNVTATPTLAVSGTTNLRWWPSLVTANGFRINFARSSAGACSFQWTAIAL